jgi:shikimate kinase
MAFPERIFLVGISGSGKSTVGPLVARALGWDFADSDRAIEAAEGREVRDIFATEGEAAFRTIECRTLAALAQRRRLVVATGGGAVLTPDSRAALATGFVAWLCIDPTRAYARLAAAPGAEERPLLAGADPPAKLQALAAARAPLYGRADVNIDAGVSPADAARDIVAAWEDARDRGLALPSGRLEPR